MPARTKVFEFLLPVALLAFVGFWFHALSAPAPVPIPPPPSAKIELQPLSAYGPPPAFDRGTEKNPLIVQFADTQKVRDQAQSQAAYQETQIVGNQRIAMITALLAVIFCVQFLGLIIQAYWMKRWVQLGENGPPPAKKDAP